MQLMESDLVFAGSFGSWDARPYDAVPMIFGRNGNFGQIIGSLINVPNLFRSGCGSDHSSMSYAGRCE